MFDDKEVAIKDDEDLDKKRAKDDFTIVRIFKFTLLGVAIIFILFIVGLVIFEICTTASLRDYAVKALIVGLPGIAVGVTAVLRIPTKP